MSDKKQSRIRRAQATRVRIALQRMNRLAVHRTNLNIYASILSADGGRVLASASTLEQEVRNQLTGTKGRGGNVQKLALTATDRRARGARDDDWIGIGHSDSSVDG